MDRYFINADQEAFKAQYGHYPSDKELQEYNALGSNDLGLLPESLSGDANDLYAEITRQQWDDFAENDIPYIKDYAAEITSDQLIDDAVSTASSTAAAGFKLSSDSLARKQQSLGLSLTSAQIQNQSADLNRAKAATTVSAMNDARLSATDRKNALMSGSYTGLSDLTSSSSEA